MSRPVKAATSITASLLLGLSLSAGVVHIDFDNFINASGNTVDLRDNNRITDQYEAAYGLTFSGVRYNSSGNRASTQYGLSVYDTSGPNTNDDDLEPTYGNVEDIFGLSATYNPGNVLVIQENGSTAEWGADDNAKGGKIKMRWEEAVTLTELVFLDIGDNDENTFGLNFKFYYADGTTSSKSNVFGEGADNITLFEPTTNSWLDNKGKSITGLDVKYKASSALASLSFTPIPEPSNLLFVGTALSMVLVGTRRRRTARKTSVTA
jgi:hypothetical protein|tara:strand:+ start:608 stop:1402 length:795 start_codon:yes stop_codon:yes gene_type:complete